MKALIADVPYSNKKLASMDMEERYRLIMSTIFNAIGCHVEVEHMLATGRIDMVVKVTGVVYVIELKLTKNGGIAAQRNKLATTTILNLSRLTNGKLLRWQLNSTTLARAWLTGRKFK